MSRVQRQRLTTITTTCALAAALAYVAPVRAQEPTVPKSGRAPAPAAIGTSDDAIEDRIDHRLQTTDPVRKYHVDAEVEGGVAVLTGEVATDAQKAAAEKLASIEGVQRVESQVTVDPDADKTLAERAKAGLAKSGEAITDAWITTKVSFLLMGEDILDEADINVDTSEGVVTLKGGVPNEAGRLRAMRLAQQTDGVKNVVDQMKVGPLK